jgi:hypothetical protein
VHGFVVADQSYRSSPDASLDYAEEVGVHTEGSTLTQRLVSDYNGKRTIGSRLYLMAPDEETYELFNLIGKEFTYEVDLSQITCGVDASLYTVQMPANGSNVSPAVWGGGYCDASYIGGAGCPSFTLQEANNRAMSFRAQPCDHAGSSKDGECAAPGCGYNAYRFGLTEFWGRTINPRQKLTVITQFVSAGPALTEIRRIYIQGGRLFQNPPVKIADHGEYSAISDEFCRASATDWEAQEWRKLTGLGESMAHAHVLVFSLWDGDDMGWLDADANGPCEDPPKESIEADSPEMTVTWSNIRFGDIDTTY